VSSPRPVGSPRLVSRPPPARFTRRLSLRSRLLLVVFGGAILPLALLGLWLTRSAERSGELLLADRLDAALQQLAEQVGPRWARVRGPLLDLAEAPDVRRRLAEDANGTAARGVPVPGDGASAQAELPAALQERLLRSSREVWLHDGSTGRSWSLASTRGDAPEPALLVRVPVHASGLGEPLGFVEAAVPAAELIPAFGGAAGGVGAVLGAFDPATGASLLPLPFDPSLLEQGRFTWEGEEWLTRYRVLAEPRLALAVAAPLNPYTAPFEAAARQGALALLVVAVTSFLLIAVLTRRFTRALAALATAAERVQRGELDQQVVVRQEDEVGAVAVAFNTMTASLRRTLDELAQREGLAAVGEFAASLAHEVRNPLTAMRIDLQAIEEQVTDARTRDGLERVLRQVQRLDATVTGALGVARSGRALRGAVDLRAAIAAACHSAGPEFAARRASLSGPAPDAPAATVRGDAAAIEQLFLNLLLNAAQALEPGGSARVVVEQDGGDVVVTVEDDGCGIEPERLATLFEPLASSRAGGSGLGLAIARRIARAHGGDVSIESDPGRGTRTQVRLPATAESSTTR
jgi:signal transduction histidine kinase